MSVSHELHPGHRNWRPEPRSLWQVVQNKAALQVTCMNRSCRHRAVLYVNPLVQRFGADCLIEELEPKLRCTRCGMLGRVKIYEIAR